MDYAELVRMYFERSSALQWYWTVYVVVAGGLLAFSSLRTRRDLVTGVLVTVLFCFFAYKNCGAIGDVTAQRAALLQSIKGVPSPGAPVDRSRLEATLVAPEWEGIRNFHVASDLLVVLALWAMEWRRVRAARGRKLVEWLSC